MKKTFILIFITSIILTSCLSTNTSNNTFSTSAKTQINNMIISTDDFAGVQTAVHKDIYMDFTSSAYTLYFEPFFVYTEDNINFYLKIQCEYFGNNLVIPQRIILLSNTGKAIINITATPEIGENKLGSGSILGRRNIITSREKISQEDYLKLSQFFEANKEVRLALYTSNNKAQELKEYTPRAHTIFADCYSYYKNNLESKTDTETVDYIIFQ